MKLRLFLTFTISHAVLEISALKTCVQKTFRGADNPMVCVCNSTYCDEFPPLGKLYIYQAAIYTSSQSGKKVERTDQIFNTDTTSTLIEFTVDSSKTYKKIIGFGGAFTDAASFNVMNLSLGARENLVNAYFGQQGIGYTMGRVPMAACDYPLRDYSYDDVDGDFNLTNFALAHEDLTYKIPFIKMVQNLIGDKFKLFLTPWSAPGWMKTNGKMHGFGLLKGDIGGLYYQTFANYFVRFFEEYAKQGVNFWGLTPQNEPTNGEKHNASLAYEEMYMNSTIERDFIKLNLGPTLKSNQLTKNIKIMIMDQNIDRLPEFPMTVLADPEAAKYVDGIAIHWYNDPNHQGIENRSSFQEVYEAHPNAFMLYTEACTFGSNPSGPRLGDWERGDNYFHDIMEDLYNWVTGWVDWNIPYFL